MGQLRQLSLPRLRAKMPQTDDVKSVWANVTRVLKLWDDEYARVYAGRSRWVLKPKYELMSYEKNLMFKLVNHYGETLACAMVWRFFHNPSGEFTIATWADERNIGALCSRNTVKEILEDLILNDPAVTLESLKIMFRPYLEGRDESPKNEAGNEGGLFTA